MKIMKNTSQITKRLGFLFALIWLIAQALPAVGEIIPANRRTDWSSSAVGVPGGIPTRTTIYRSLAAGASSAQIQAALDACPANQVVLLGPGDFPISST